MPVSSEIREGVLRLKVSGELGVPAAFDLRDAIAAGLREARRVEVDLSGAESLGSACLQILYLLWTEAAAWEVEAEMTALSDAARRVLAASGLEGFFSPGAVRGS